jgi:hypothetical protein
VPAVPMDLSLAAIEGGDGNGDEATDPAAAGNASGGGGAAAGGGGGGGSGGGDVAIDVAPSLADGLQDSERLEQEQQQQQNNEADDEREDAVEERMTPLQQMATARHFRPVSSGALNAFAGRFSEATGQRLRATDDGRKLVAQTLDEAAPKSLSGWIMKAGRAATTEQQQQQQEQDQQGQAPSKLPPLVGRRFTGTQPAMVQVGGAVNGGRGLPSLTIPGGSPASSSSSSSSSSTAAALPRGSTSSGGPPSNRPFSIPPPFAMPNGAGVNAALSPRSAVKQQQQQSTTTTPSTTSLAGLVLQAKMSNRNNNNTRANSVLLSPGVAANFSPAPSPSMPKR